MLNAKEFAGTIEALLNLLGNKQDTVLFAQVIQLFHKDRMPCQQPCITLHRLNDDSRNLLRRQIGCKCSFDICDTFLLAGFIIIGYIIKREAVNIRQHRTHLCTHTRCYHGHGNRTVCAAMICVDKCDNLASAGVSSCKFHCRIIRIGTAVAENDFCRHTARVNRSQPFRIFNALSAIGISNRILRIIVQLFLYSRRNDGIAAAQIQGRCTGKEIDILVIIFIVNNILVNLFDYHRIIGQMLGRRKNLFISFHPRIAFLCIQCHKYHSLL